MKKSLIGYIVLLLGMAVWLYGYFVPAAAHRLARTHPVVDRGLLAEHRGGNRNGPDVGKRSSYVLALN